jgi:hypothetical protein
MHSSIRPYTTGLAAIGASIIALGMVSAPPDVSRVDLAVTRPVEVHVIQLAAATSATVSREAAAPSVINEAAAPTIGGTVRSIEIAALGVAIAAVWYLAAPVTFPLTVGFIYLGSQFNFPHTNPTLATYVAAFVGIPFSLAEGLVPPNAPASATGPAASRAINTAAAPGRTGRTASAAHAARAGRLVGPARAEIANTPKVLGHAKKAAAPAGSVHAARVDAARHTAKGRGAPSGNHLSRPAD